MLNSNLLTLLKLANPWLEDENKAIFHQDSNFCPRQQAGKLLESTWDDYISLLTGPRQVGKTTLGRFICQQLVSENRFTKVLYLNCDEHLIREWLTGSQVIADIKKLLDCDCFILFIDEVQRLQNPGLLLKSIYDLKLPIKLIATGSLQLELKSKVQEHLTGRHLEVVVLPLSYAEQGNRFNQNSNLIYGAYPKVVTEKNKAEILNLLFQNYLNKDIIEILKIRNADVMQKLVTLIAHASGQLVNYQQLAADCRSSSHTIQHYLDILKGTYVLDSISPFVGNKRQEVTTNPIFYFLDNGFRNQALNNFSLLESRVDLGLLIESAVFQELLKLKMQHFLNYSIHYWRTKGGAEVDFILRYNDENVLPIEVKYRSMKTGKITRGFRSFIEAYQPKFGFVITKDLYGEMQMGETEIRFIPFDALSDCLSFIHDWP